MLVPSLLKFLIYIHFVSLESRRAEKDMEVKKPARPDTSPSRLEGVTFALPNIGNDCFYDPKRFQVN